MLCLSEDGILKYTELLGHTWKHIIDEWWFKFQLPSNNEWGGGAALEEVRPFMEEVEAFNGISPSYKME